MTALAYTSGTAIITRMANDGQSVVTSTEGTAILNTIGTAVNDIIEGYIGGPIGPSGTAARTYDGNGESRLTIYGGINSVTVLRIKDVTGGSWTTITSTKYALRPHDHERPSGWPAFHIDLLTELGPQYATFTRGYDTVEVTPGATDALGWGWPAIPPELSQIGVVLGTRMYQARQSGETLVIGSTEFGQSIARFLPEPEYRMVLDRYRLSIKSFDGV